MRKLKHNRMKLAICAVGTLVGSLMVASNSNTAVAGPSQEAENAKRPEETTKAKTVDFVSVAQLKQIEQGIPKLKPGMPDKQVLTILGLTNSQLQSIERAGGRFGFCSLYIYDLYSLREGIRLLIVHDYARKPRKFVRAEIQRKNLP